MALRQFIGRRILVFECFIRSPIYVVVYVLGSNTPPSRDAHSAINHSIMIYVKDCHIMIRTLASTIAACRYLHKSSTISSRPIIPML